MRFSVCVKQVPDVTAPNRLQDGQIVQDTERLVLNAYDASALEESLVLREAHGGEIEVVLVGSDGASEAIRKALAMGADKGTHISTDRSEFDSRAYAEILAAFFKRQPTDIILCGKQSQDTDAGLTGAMLAELLGLPYTTNAVGLELESGAIKVTRQADTGREIMRLPIPCLVTCSNDMNDPRIPSLKGIMQSKRKPVDKLPLADLQIDESLASVEQNAARRTGYSAPAPRPAARMLEGEPAEVVDLLMTALKNESKSI